jgi:hypothetical protein
VSEEGLTAWQLLYKLWGGTIPDEATLKLRTAAHPPEEYWERVLRRAYTVLKNRLYVGWGYLPGSEERERIPPDLWGRLHIDLSGNMAAGGGFEFYDLRFYEAKPAAPAWKADLDDAYVAHIKATFVETSEPPTIADDNGWRKRQTPKVPRARMRELRRVHNTAKLKEPPN